MDGILLVDKPEGMTSAEVVRRVKRRLNTKTGHLGTLDPFASGLLPLCLGEGTKIAPFLNDADKSYVGSIQLGCRTDSGDRTGAVVDTAAVPAAADVDLDTVAAALTGPQQQVPPMHSAVKRAGQPLYKLAHRGITVEREPRAIVIHELHLRWEAADSLGFTVSCSKGTYIRVLAEDIARALGTVGHVRTLRRTGFGHFIVAAAISLDAVEANPGAGVLSPSAALEAMEAVRLRPEDVHRARQGREALLAQLQLPTRAAALKLLSAADELVAVLTRKDDGTWRYARVFGGND